MSIRLPQAFFMLLLVAVILSAEPQGGGPKMPRAGGRGGFPKGGAPKAGPNGLGRQVRNPANPVARLYRSTPEERERALEKLPPAQQEKFRQNLQWFDGLPKSQQEMVLKQVDRFSALPPERQREFQGHIRDLSRLPQERRAAVGAALRHLQSLPGERRAEVLESEAFQTRFTPEEQRIIADLSEVMLPP